MVDTKAEKDEPNVNELNPAFVEIRSHIFSVCHKLDLDSPIKTPLSYPDSIKKIYSKIAKLRNKESRKRLMRSEMYEVLQEDIFEGTCFGLTGDIERDLGKVEKQIKKAQQGMYVGARHRVLALKTLRRRCTSFARMEKTYHSVRSTLTQVQLTRGARQNCTPFARPYETLYPSYQVGERRAI